MGRSSKWFFFWICSFCCFFWVLGEGAVWEWQCVEGSCQKLRIDPDAESSPVSLAACQLFCSNYASLWPYPTGKVSIGSDLVNLNVSNINVVQSNANTSDIFEKAFQRFKEQTEAKGSEKARNASGKSLLIYANLTHPEIDDLLLNKTDESYTLEVYEDSTGSLNAVITADNFFGARHAIETLGQLIIYDDFRDEILIPQEVTIEDGPAYPYRGLMLDTSRNFISVDTIKRNIDAMACSKLNRFHWHITDSQSFPFYSKRRPEFSQLGAYSPSKVYSPEDIADIVEYARIRGVKVVPEFDAPAHVGEGWQDTDYVVCLNKQPWTQYCGEPPCGQLNPTKEGLYEVLEDIYADMLELFNPDVFHMGGDEVSFNCWKSVDEILEWMENNGLNSTNQEENFIKLWNIFQTKALAKLDGVSKQELPIIMWTSDLTKLDYVERYLPKDRYIIQIWTTGTDTQVTSLLDANYKLILSNYDALYFDCGFAGWVSDGNNWCSPYIGWQKVYSNSPEDIAGTRKNQILGSEAALWTEQADDSTVDGRFWPRAAAMAEVLWSEPTTTWREAETRMLIHRERLVRDTGVQAEALEPQWCLQNENNCPA